MSDRNLRLQEKRVAFTFCYEMIRKKKFLYLNGYERLHSKFFAI